jgi:hypothetical protein
MNWKSVHVTAESRATPSQVWTLLADGPSWTRWAGFDKVGYDREGDPAPHGLGAVRRIRIGRLTSTENVLAFEEDRRLSYDYVGTLPFKTYRADVTLTAVEGGTLIDWRSQFTTKYPFTGALLRLVMTRVLADISKRLAAAAEGVAPDEPSAS